MDGLLKMTGRGLRELLVPFLRWLRETKGARIDATDNEIIDEWCTIAMGQVGSLVNRVKSFLSDEPDDDELPTDGELPTDDEVN